MYAALFKGTYAYVCTVYDIPFLSKLFMSPLQQCWRQSGLFLFTCLNLR